MVGTSLSPPQTLRDLLAKVHLRLIVFAVILAAAGLTVSGVTAQQEAALTALDFKPVGENYELGLNERLLFDIDSSTIAGSAQASLTHLTEMFGQVGIHGAAIEGHTDSTGTAQHNKDLRLRRADAVKATLVQTGMVAAGLRTSGKGEGQPIADNRTAEGRSQNRRVVIIVTPEDAS